MTPEEKIDEVFRMYDYIVQNSNFRVTEKLDTIELAKWAVQEAADEDMWREENQIAIRQVSALNRL
jgi:hypothetical protein